MVQIGADTFEDLTPEIFERLLDDLAAGKKVTPGPAIKRQFSAPAGGPTTLADLSLYKRGSTRVNVGPSLTDDSAKRPTEGASQRAAPVAQKPLKPNPEDKKPDPVSKG
jgi:NADH-quinone oxidoreductase subunit E